MFAGFAAKSDGGITEAGVGDKAWTNFCNQCIKGHNVRCSCNEKKSKNPLLYKMCCSQNPIFHLLLVVSNSSKTNKACDMSCSGIAVWLTCVEDAF